MMQRTLQIFIVSIALTGLIFPAYAQDDVQVERVATLEAMVSSLEAEVDQAEIAIATAIAISDDAQDKLDEAGRRANDASNILGIFEQIGAVISVFGVLFAIAGIRSLLSAEDNLTKTRDTVLGDLEEAREKFDSEFNNQRAKFDELEAEIKEADTKRGETTENAILAQAYLSLGEKLYQDEKYGDVIHIYKTALKLAPNNSLINYRLGYVYTQKRETLNDARKHYEKVLDKTKEFAPALAGLGFVIRREAEDMEEGIDKIQTMNKAEEYLVKALDITPNLLDEDGESWWGVLGGLYRRRGRVDDAIIAYKKATEVTPHSSYGFGNLALLYGKKRDYDKMIETYRKVEDLSDTKTKRSINDFWAHADLIVSRYALGKADQAAKNLDRALQIAPIESSYMLQGLREGLQELTTILVETDKIPAIEDAIKRIEAVEAERSAIAENNEEST